MSWNDIKTYQSRYLAPDKFISENGFNRVASYNGAKSIEMILRSGTFSSCYTPHHQGYEDIPYLDHALIYKNSKEKISCLVYQPYQDADNIREEVEKWAESKGLKAYITEKHWYNEGTCEVFIMLSKVSVCI